jgi:hypothetical protein
MTPVHVPPYCIYVSEGVLLVDMMSFEWFQKLSSICGHQLRDLCCFQSSPVSGSPDMSTLLVYNAWQIYLKSTKFSFANIRFGFCRHIHRCAGSIVLPPVMQRCSSSLLEEHLRRILRK